jgi:hypothetical protein
MDFTGCREDAGISRQADQDDAFCSEIREQRVQWGRVERGMLGLKDNVIVWKWHQRFNEVAVQVHHHVDIL